MEFYLKLSLILIAVDAVIIILFSNEIKQSEEWKMFKDAVTSLWKKIVK